MDKSNVSQLTRVTQARCSRGHVLQTVRLSFPASTATSYCPQCRKAHKVTAMMIRGRVSAIAMEIKDAPIS